MRHGRPELRALVGLERGRGDEYLQIKGAVVKDGVVAQDGRGLRKAEHPSQPGARCGEGVGADALHACGDIELIERRAVAKGLFAQLHKAGTQLQLRERAAIAERAVVHEPHRIREPQLPQDAAPAEGRSAYLRQGLGQGEPREAAAVDKALVAYARQSLGQIDGVQGVAGREGVVVNAAVRDGYAAQGKALAEGVEADGRQPRRHDGAAQAEAVHKGALAHLRKPQGHADGLEKAAPRKGAFPDLYARAHIHAVEPAGGRAAGLAAIQDVELLPVSEDDLAVRRGAEADDVVARRGIGVRKVYAAVHRVRLRRGAVSPVHAESVRRALYEAQVQLGGRSVPGVQIEPCHSVLRRVDSAHFRGAPARLELFQAQAPALEHQPLMDRRLGQSLEPRQLLQRVGCDEAAVVVEEVHFRVRQAAAHAVYETRVSPEGRGLVRPPAVLGQGLAYGGLRVLKICQLIRSRSHQTASPFIASRTASMSPRFASAAARAASSPV